LRATVSHFEIPARDLERAARFYREVFGWRIEPLPWEGHPYYKVRGASGEPPGREGIDGGLLPAGVTTGHPLLVIHLSGIGLEDCLAKIVEAGGQVDPAGRGGGDDGPLRPLPGSRGERAGVVEGRLVGGQPFVSVDASLPKDTDQKIQADFLTVGIRQDQTHVSAKHELMPSTREGTFESKPTQALNQLAPADRSEPRHAGRGNWITTLPIGGIGSPL
jgi:predicted enzyme related to lactoylglutathione lyase